MTVLRGRWITYSSVVAAGAIVALLWLVTSPQTKPSVPSSPSVSLSRQKALLPTPLAASTHQSQPSLKSLATFTSATTASDARAAWRKSRKDLLNHPNGTQAVKDLKTLLASGENHALDTPLRVSAGGELLEAPTTRVYLLDLLAQLDSVEAAEYSRTILEESTSSDEWAIALRNYAWGIDNAASDPFLREKVFELLTNETWIKQPTSGFLEALDFVPYTQDPTLVTPLVALTKAEQPANVRRAAFLALARFFSQSTTAGLQSVSDAEENEPFSPVRADAMSRANFSRSEDVDIVRSYLLSNTIDPSEYAIFAETFPQGGQFAGPALVTRFRAEPFSALARRDARALSIVENWLQDSAFEARKKELLQIYQRLIRLKESALSGGYL